MHVDFGDTFRWFKSNCSVYAKAVRFGAIGAASSLLSAALTIVLVSWLGTSPQAASLISYAGALPINFLANRAFAFQSAGAINSDVIRYLVMHLAGLIVTYASVWFVTDYCNSDYRIGVVLAMIVVPCVSFVVSNSWVFHNQRR